MANNFHFPVKTKIIPTRPVPMNRIRLCQILKNEGPLRKKLIECITLNLLAIFKKFLPDPEIKNLHCL
jgi:hypothetical protein